MRLSIADESWLESLLESLRDRGYALVEGALDDDFVEESRRRLYGVRDAIHQSVGRSRLERAGELGVLRNMIRFDRFFARYLEIPEILRIVDATVSETAILHLQNGFILEASARDATPDVFQNTFHRDFPRHLNGYLASVNVFVALDDFTEDNGATRVVPGSHQRATAPEPGYLERAAVPVLCPAGTLLVFDSTLWHAAGHNVSDADRRSINHQFTRSFFKQQIDYVRALDSETIASLPERSRQLLGWYTRVVTSLDEYYRPAEERLYRSGQG